MCEQNISINSEEHQEPRCTINVSDSPPYLSIADDDKGVLFLNNETSYLLQCPWPHSTITRSSGTIISEDPSSFSRSRTNNTTSASYQNPPPLPEEGQATYSCSGAKRRRINALSTTFSDLRSCSTYVTRVKDSLLASNHAEKFNAFLDLLCNWRNQGLAPQEVFSQMQQILQDVSPELLAAFTAYLPDHMQEEARLQIAVTQMSSTRGAQEGRVSSTNDNCLATE